ncbi:hypothetical protein X975_07331, partial [Stegodyphus mimosarum]
MTLCFLKRSADDIIKKEMKSCLIFLLSLPLILGQLVLGPCPKLQEFVQDLDYNKYSGKWYVVAQSRRHPMRALECQTVNYTQNSNGLDVEYNTAKKYLHMKNFDGGLLKRESGKSSGELSLFLPHFPQRLQFRVLKANYSEFAVEYVCLPGVFNYTSSVTLLHRKPQATLQNLELALQPLNIQKHVNPHIGNPLIPVNHTNCNQ